MGVKVIKLGSSSDYVLNKQMVKFISSCFDLRNNFFTKSYNLMKLNSLLRLLFCCALYFMFPD